MIGPSQEKPHHFQELHHNQAADASIVKLLEERQADHHQDKTNVTDNQIAVGPEHVPKSPLLQGRVFVVAQIPQEVAIFLDEVRKAGRAELNSGIGYEAVEDESVVD